MRQLVRGPVNSMRRLWCLLLTLALLIPMLMIPGAWAETPSLWNLTMYAYFDGEPVSASSPVEGGGDLLLTLELRPASGGTWAEALTEELVLEVPAGLFGGQNFLMENVYFVAGDASFPRLLNSDGESYEVTCSPGGAVDRYTIRFNPALISYLQTHPVGMTSLNLSVEAEISASFVPPAGGEISLGIGDSELILKAKEPEDPTIPPPSLDFTVSKSAAHALHPLNNENGDGGYYLRSTGFGGTVAPGEILFYSLTVKNPSDAWPLTLNTVQDILPATLDFLPAEFPFSLDGTPTTVGGYIAATDSGDPDKYLINDIDFDTVYYVDLDTNVNKLVQFYGKTGAGTGTGTLQSTTGTTWVYTFGDGLEVPAGGTVVVWVAAKVKENANPYQNAGNTHAFTNNMKVNDTKTAGLTSTLRTSGYDLALKTYFTRFHDDAGVVGATYPETGTTKAVEEGFYVTGVVSVMNQSIHPVSSVTVTVYLPEGLELVTDLADLPAGSHVRSAAGGSSYKVSQWAPVTLPTVTKNTGTGVWSGLTAYTVTHTFPSDTLGVGGTNTFNYLVKVTGSESDWEDYPENYYLAAEITGFTADLTTSRLPAATKNALVTAGKIDVSGTVLVDEDSWIGTVGQPEKNLVSNTDGTTVHPITAMANRKELRQNLSGHAKNFTTTLQDEDDFDFDSLIFTVTDTETNVGVVQKSRISTGTNGAALNLSNLVAAFRDGEGSTYPTQAYNALNAAGYKPLGPDNYVVSGDKYVMLYEIWVNRDGTYQVDGDTEPLDLAAVQAQLTDTLPEGLRFFSYNADGGTKYAMNIVKYVPINPAAEKIDTVTASATQKYYANIKTNIKNHIGTAGGTGYADGDANYFLAGSGQLTVDIEEVGGRDKLTIDFGNAVNAGSTPKHRTYAAYRILALVVTDNPAIGVPLRNTAELIGTGIGESGAEEEFSIYVGGRSASSAVTKFVGGLPEGWVPPQAGGEPIYDGIAYGHAISTPLVVKEGDDTFVYVPYRILLCNSRGVPNYKQQLDAITDTVTAGPFVEFVGTPKVVTYTGATLDANLQPILTAAVEEDTPSFAVTPANNKLTITHNVAFSADKPEVHLVDFVVKYDYSRLAPGALLGNTVLGLTVNSVNPVSLAVVKQDTATSDSLTGHTFALFYADGVYGGDPAGLTPVLDMLGDPVVIAGDGASAPFLPDGYDGASKTTQTWKLWLVETVTPDGYGQNENLYIPLTLTKAASGTLSMVADNTALSFEDFRLASSYRLISGQPTLTVKNTKDPAPIDVPVGFTKLLDGTVEGLTAEQFSFELVGVEGTTTQGFSQTAKNAADGSVTFRLTGLTEGTYTFEARETDNGVPFIRDHVVYDVEVKVYPNAARQELSYTVTCWEQGEDESSGDPAFRNKTPDPIDVVLTARKTLNSAAPGEARFDFELCDTDGTVLQTVQNDDDGVVTFAPIRYSEEGGDSYLIREVQGDGGYHYDTAEYLVNVIVEFDSAQEKFVATLELWKDDAPYDGEEPVFANRRRDDPPAPKPDAASVTLTAAKRVNGAAPTDADETFTFQLLNAQGNVIQTQTNAGGQVSFDLTYSASGTYRYTIREVAGSGPYDYDDAEFDVTVTVRLVSGAFQTDVDYGQSPVFQNRREVTQTDVTVTKVWVIPAGSTAEIPAGIRVQLYGDGVAYGSPVTLTEADHWTHSWRNLDNSVTWTVEELDVPQGFTSRVAAEGANTFRITNTAGEEEESVVLRVLKRSQETGEALARATFALYRDRALIATAVTGADGVAEFELPNARGSYVLRETGAPDGYLALGVGDIVFALDDGGIIRNFSHIGQAGMAALTGDGLEITVYNIPDDGSNPEGPGNPEGPDEILVIDEDGTPLGKWVKDPDGFWEFVELDEEEAPRAGLLPKTGSYLTALALLSAAMLCGAGLMLGRKKRDR